MLYTSKHVHVFLESYEIGEYVFRDAVRRMAQLFHNRRVTCDNRMHEPAVSRVLCY